jgi:hypothetical protein
MMFESWVFLGAFGKCQLGASRLGQLLCLKVVQNGVKMELEFAEGTINM